VAVAVFLIIKVNFNFYNLWKANKTSNVMNQAEILQSCFLVWQLGIVETFKILIQKRKLFCENCLYKH